MARLSLIIRITAALALLLLSSACSNQLVLANARVAPPALTAQLGPRPARFYIDRVKTPFLNEHRIGSRKSLAGRFTGWITTDSDVGEWARWEWRAFLIRHRQGVVSIITDAAYMIQCEITSLSVGKKYGAIWDDEFNAHIECTVVVKEMSSGKSVCTQHISADSYARRPNADKDTVSDDTMYNRSLSTAFQKALEQVVFRDVSAPAPVNFFPSISPL